MDSKRLKELAGVVEAATEQEKALETAGVTEEKVLAEDAGLAEGGFGFGPAGHGGDKTPEQNVMSQLSQMLRDAKIFLRDGNIEDATMMIDRAYSAASKSNRG